MSAAAVIILRRKKFIRRFAERGATLSSRCSQGACSCPWGLTGTI
jgi:hypothetical protein